MEHRRTAELQRRVNDLTEFEVTHAPRIQSWVRNLVHEHEVHQLAIAEYRDALAQRVDNSREVEESRSQIKYWKDQYNEAVENSSAEIRSLKSKLDALRSPQELSKQVLVLQKEVASYKSRVKTLLRERDQLQKQLTVARGTAAKSTPATIKVW
ncbi:unnamed protein product [Peronospora effusa]|nr:unnamed protein product [Peronospora effusa]